MTTNVPKGANRASSNARRARAAQNTPLPPKGATSAPGKSVTAALIKEELLRKPTARRARRAIAESPVPAPPSAPAAQGKPVPADYHWISDKSLGENVHLAREAKVAWRRIAELATAAGHETPWPDGGRLLRAQKAHLAGTEGSLKPQVSRAASRRSSASDVETERVYRAGAVRTDHKMPDWEDDKVLTSVRGRRIYWTNGVSGAEASAHVPATSTRVRVRVDPKDPQGKRVLEFPELIETDADTGEERLGPLRTVRLSTITVIE